MKPVLAFLFLLALLAPTLPHSLAQQPSPDEWRVDDDPGDPEFEELPGQPPQGVRDAADILSFALKSETEETFELEWRVQELKTSDRADGGATLWLSFRFESPGGGRFLIEATLYGHTDTASGGTPFFQRVDAEICGAYGEDFSCGVGRQLAVTLDDAKNTVTVVAVREPMRAYDGKTYTLAKGDELTDLRIQSHLQTTVLRVADEVAPEQPGPVLRKESANTRLRFLNGPSVVPVVWGANVTQPVTLENQGNTKELVRLEYVLRDAKGWAAGGPRSIQIPAKSNRTFDIWVAAPASLSDQRPVLDLRGSSVVDPERVAVHKVPLAGTPTFDEEAPEVYLHGMPQSGQCYDPPCTRGYAAFRADDARRASPNEMVLWRRSPYQLDRFYASETFLLEGQFLPQPVVINASLPTKGYLNLRTVRAMENVDMSLQVRLYIPGAPSSITLIDCEKTLTIPEGTRKLELVCPTKKVLSPVPRASSLSVHVVLSGFSGLNTEIILLGGESYVRFPVQAVPAPPPAPDGQFHFQAAFLGENDKFVNPGESQVFEIGLLNQGEIAHGAKVEAESQHPGWSVSVHPGTRYELDPGANVRVGVLVGAPADAAEGARNTVRIRIQEEGGGMVEKLAFLTAIASVPFDDEAGNYTADQDAEEAVVQEAPQKTPGPTVPFLFAAALLWATRRRS